MWYLEWFSEGRWRRDRYFQPVERDEAQDFLARLQKYTDKPCRVVLK